jgi:GAF domain-containing protein
MKKRQRLTTKPKHPNAPKVARRRESPADGLSDEVARLTRERDEALARENATAEILASIRGSMTDAKPVFDAIVRTVSRLFGTRFTIITLLRGDMIEIGGFVGDPGFEKFAARFPVPLNEHSLAGKTILAGRAMVLAPINGNPDAPPLAAQSAREFGFNSQLATPMLREGKPIGAIVTAHRDEAAFNDQKVALIKSFADQAVIAIENARMFNELRESLEQQTATSKVLEVISSSPGELEPVFNAMLENAVRICQAKFGIMYRYDKGAFHTVALFGVPAPYAEFLRRRGSFLPEHSGGPMSCVLQTKQIIHTIDATADQNPGNAARLGGARSLVAVPMLRESDLIGMAVIYRTEVRPFSDKQIELVQNFAAQAVIAIENTRLLSELRQRTDDLSESLEQQIATSEVLRVISSSSGELGPVFQAMLENAVRICDAKFGTLFRYDNEAFDPVAHFGATPAYAEFHRQRGSFRPAAGTPLDRLLQKRVVVRIADDAAEAARSIPLKLGGARSLVAVPMFKENMLLGAITIYRQEVSVFTDKQIALVQNFAAQAVIAIENARLLNELRQRTDELSGSLERQTATSEVLRVISSSPSDLEPVFQSMLDNATRICEAKFGALFRFNGEAFHLGADIGSPPKFAAYLRRRGWFLPTPGSGLDHVLQTKTLRHTADYGAEAVSGPPVLLGGARSTIDVPMLKDGVLVGAIAIYRQEVRPFTDKQIELVQNFATQAVIAIENTRLLNELRESLEQQTATSEVLSVISSSPGELEPVFHAALANAVRICGAKFGNLSLFDGYSLRVAAMHNAPRELEELRRRDPVIDLKTSIARPLIETKRVVHVLDLTAEAPYSSSGLAKGAGARTALAVPMLRDETLVGMISIYRQEVLPFTNKQIELVQNFAAQAVIAIENTRLLSELRQRTTDLTESLEQQTATSEVLKVISSSPGELEPVFNAMLENAARICEAKFGVMFRFDEDASYVVATLNLPPSVVDFFQQRGRLKPTPGSDLDTLWKSKQVVHTIDMLASQTPSRIAKLADVRTQLAVPMLLDDKLIGAINLHRQEVRPFTDKQIELVQNFAAQAVIAIENTRLLNELRDSLQQQTATADVLQVISSSPSDLKPVFNAMLENATRICDARFGNMFLYDGDAFRAVALHGAPPRWLQARTQNPVFRPGPNSPLGGLVTTKRVEHVADARLHQAYLEGEPTFTLLVDLGEARTALAVPMLKEGELVGAIAIYRQEVRPFTDKQIELVKNFAAQAVIAVENTRLLNELRQRTNDLTESLEQQTATAEVLRVISSSPGELEPVFQAMLEKATRICEAKFGVLFRVAGDLLHLAAEVGTPPEFAEFMRRRGPFQPQAGTYFERVMRNKQVSHTADAVAEGGPSPAAKFGGARSMVTVPMLKDDLLIGLIAIYRQEVRPFSNKQIELLTSFAAQAVIAIENTRLLSELRESLQQQTATAEVLRVISSSPGDLKPIFQAMLENATRICEANFGTLALSEGDEFRLVALHDAPTALNEARLNQPMIRPGPGHHLVRLVHTKQLVHIADLSVDQAAAPALAKLAGARTLLTVPLLKDNELVGAMAIYRQEVRPFSGKQIELLTNFAAQAVIAIENTRLLNELRQRTDDLTASLEDLRTAQDRLVQTEKLASLGQLTAGIAHEIKNPLNFVNNFSSVSVELIDELSEVLGTVKTDEKTRDDIAELADTLRGNLEKIVQHGKRADAIVKNMLLHSRQGSGEHRPVDINALVEESLNLAYHGARAETQGFNITLERSFDPAAGEVDLFPQEITRVLLNLISNGFYAATKRKAEANGGGYEPILAATTKNLGNSVEIRIRDNGTGIPPEVKEKMFNPFFTTKPAGEGTGLGLSISHDIIVKQHSGSIDVDTKPGEFTEFRIVLPRGAATIAKSGEHA